MTTNLEIEKAKNADMIEVLDAMDISYKRVGRIVKTRCIFHDEYQDSLAFYSTGYHCFGCGAHGSVITFVMKVFDVPFIKAVQVINKLIK